MAPPHTKRVVRLVMLLGTAIYNGTVSVPGLPAKDLLSEGKPAKREAETADRDAGSTEILREIRDTLARIEDKLGANK